MHSGVQYHVKKIVNLHLQNPEGSVCREMCLTSEPCCFHSLPSARNGSSQMPFLVVNIWFQLFTLQASNHLHGIRIPAWWKTGRFGVIPTLSSAHPSPGLSCSEPVCLKVVWVGKFAHSQPLLSQKLLQHLNAISV